MKKICFVTSSRADYGLLRPVMQKFREADGVVLQIIATGTHLSDDHGYTVNEILKDGYSIDEEVRIVGKSDTADDVCQSAADAIRGVSEALMKLKPDLMIVLGDRYEIFAAAMAATVHRIPIAHLHGGEVTEGAMDECFRHSITKMSHLHFTSTEAYRDRVIQLGENPDKVWNVGAVGVENALNIEKISKKKLFESLSIPEKKKLFLITYHPETLGSRAPTEQINEVLDALSQFEDAFCLFTKANADTAGSIINDKIEAYVRDNPKTASVFASLGYLRYLNLVKYSDVVIGNSSSGILEVPSLGVPTVNIGDRQKGRIRSESVIDVKCKAESVSEAIHKAISHSFREACKGFANPYEKDDTSSEIFLGIIKELECGISIQKRFFDLH